MATFEKSLLDRAVEIDLSDVQDLTTKTVLVRTLRGPTMTSSGRQRDLGPARTPSGGAVLEDIVALLSLDRDDVLRVLRSERTLPPPLVPHVIPLSAWHA